MLHLRVSLVLRRCLLAITAGAGLATAITYQAAAGRTPQHAEYL